MDNATNAQAHADAAIEIIDWIRGLPLQREGTIAVAQVHATLAVWAELKRANDGLNDDMALGDA